MQLNWTIIGCGWLGVPLAEKLIERGYTVFGSTTREAKLSELTEKGIAAFVLNEHSKTPAEISNVTDIVVLSIPPIKRENIHAYGSYLCSITDQFRQETRFIFLGSTGIYPQKSGVYSENYTFKTDEQETVLFKAEEQLNALLGARLTRLRLGGLIGEERHPIRSLSGKVDVKNPEGVINFVNKKDIVELIISIVEKEVFGDVFNVVYPLHPTREKYYTELAQNFNIPVPKFDHSSSIIRKISSEKVIANLGFIFEHSIY